MKKTIGIIYIFTFAFLAAFSALTWLGVFRDGVLAPAPELVTLETDLASSLSPPAPTESLVTLRALFIRSAFGVFTEMKSKINVSASNINQNPCKK